MIKAILELLSTQTGAAAPRPHFKMHLNIKCFESIWTFNYGQLLKADDASDPQVTIMLWVVQMTTLNTSNTDHLSSYVCDIKIGSIYQSFSSLATDKLPKPSSLTASYSGASCCFEAVHFLGFVFGFFLTEMSKMLLLTLSLFTPLCSLCKDSVHTDLIRSKGTPIHLLPNGIASSRGEGWHSPCQGDGEVLLLIIAVDGGNNLSRHQARQLSIKVPLLHFHLWLLQPLLSLCAPSCLPFPLLSFTVCPLQKSPVQNLQPGQPRSEHNGRRDILRMGPGQRWKANINNRCVPVNKAPFGEVC